MPPDTEVGASYPVGDYWQTTAIYSVNFVTEETVIESDTWVWETTSPNVDEDEEPVAQIVMLS